MASSRKTGTNEIVDTIGTGKDFSSLSLWEGATDNAIASGLYGAVISGETGGRFKSDDAITFSPSGSTATCRGVNVARSHMWFTAPSGSIASDTSVAIGGISATVVSVDGDTNQGVSPTGEIYGNLGANGLNIGTATTTPSYFRTLRPATAFHAGVPGAGVKITNSGGANAYVLQAGEANLHLQDLEVQLTTDTASAANALSLANYAGIEVVGCLVKASNVTGTASGITQPNAQDTVVTNCIAYECKTDGFVGRGANCRFLNCTAVGNSGYGFSYNTTPASWLNCLAQDNTGGDYDGAGSATGTGYCISKDVTAASLNGSGNAQEPVTFTNVGSDIYTLGSDPTNSGTDLSAATWPFDDDIAKATRSGWDVGASEFTGGAPAIVLTANCHEPQLGGSSF